MKHIIQKRNDAPSGTAISLADGLIQKHQAYNSWKNLAQSEKDVLPIISNRIDHVPGTHEIEYLSPIDDISIKHTAHTREGFAKGALLAAEWIIDKQGVFNMQDVLRI